MTEKDEPTVPAGAAAPAEVKVEVAPSLAATGTETFHTGQGLFEEKPDKTGDTTVADATMSPHLLTYPFIAVFELAATVRQWDGWKLTSDQRQYFDKLSAYLLKRFSKVKDLDLLVAIAGIGAMMVEKTVGDIEYHKLHPIVKETPPNNDTRNPSSPAGGQPPRK